MRFRFRYFQGPGHTEVRLFAGKSEGSLGCAGSFVLRNDEFEIFKENIESLNITAGQFKSATVFEFLNEEQDSN